MTSLSLSCDAKNRELLSQYMRCKNCPLFGRKVPEFLLVLLGIDFWYNVPSLMMWGVFI